MLNTALTLAAAGGHEGGHIVNELPMHPIWYGVIVFVALMALLMAIMSMRSVGLRHPEPTTAMRPHGGADHGRGSHTAGH
ncbi:hypothetical protein [Micrococcus sp.]|uniref:hypothetical protein n=1 Tax=Micrococcus sp. TaxID=1271 RepID=UPI002A916B73|nr:hypothetical protein [Micrococcus sp.]MDY6055141.1 hypothetical protein [Micrococcus sp.]